jgi:hypothetical protein
MACGNSIVAARALVVEHSAKMVNFRADLAAGAVDAIAAEK